MQRDVISVVVCILLYTITFLITFIIIVIITFFPNEKLRKKQLSDAGFISFFAKKKY